MSESVLDASALLTALLGEPGEARTREAIGAGAVIGTVNLAEVVARLSDLGLPEQEGRRRVRQIALDVTPFDEELAYAVGALRPLTRHLGLSLGDRACLALAQRLGLPALTADRAWGTLQLGIAIEVVR